MTITNEFKTICRKIGLILGAILLSRLVTEGVSLLLAKLLEGAGPTVSYVISWAVAVVLLYGGMIVSTAFILGYKRDNNKLYYKKCKRLGKAVAWVLPSYGAGQLINITVLAISFLLANNKGAVQDTYAPITGGAATSFISVIFLVIQMIVIAPIFEEFWVRGMIQTELSKYGHGFSIMVSALIFGFAHGNVHQFCFTFVIGIALGYVRYATDSIIPTTIIHFILNSIAAIITLIASSDPVISAITKLQQGAELNNVENTMVVVLCVFVILVFVFMFAGMINAISRLKNNRLYRPVNNYPTMTKTEKLTALIKDPVFLISCILSVAFMIAIIFI